MRNIIAAGLVLAGFLIAHAQTVTPGIGGVAVTGQSGVGAYLPYTGGAYTSPYSRTQYSYPSAYNYNSGGYNNGLSNANYYSSPYSNGT